MIQSDEYDLEQSEWRSVLNLRNRTLDREIDVESVRKFVAAEQDTDPESVSADAIKREVRAEFDLPDRLSDADAERVLGEALDHVAGDEIDEAIEVLSEVFTTPCEETTPEFVDHGSGHRSACLRNEPDVRADSIAATNND